MFAALSSGLPSGFPDRLNAANSQAYLDNLPSGEVLTLLAEGKLIPEIAIIFGLDIVATAKWINKNISQEDYNLAKQTSAEIHVARAEKVLTQIPKNAQEAAMMRAYADKAMSIAERLDPNRWGTKRNPAGEQVVVPIQINIRGDIPGLQVLENRNTLPAPELENPKLENDTV
jgi:hypothetical protein